MAGEFDDILEDLGYGAPKKKLGDALYERARAKGKEIDQDNTDILTDLGYGAPQGPNGQPGQSPYSGPNAALAAKEIPNAKPGPNGLVWGPSGGWDPKTGELVIAGKPFVEPEQTFATRMANAASLGLGNKLAAEVAARQPGPGTFDDRYNSAMSAINEGARRYEATNPAASVVADIAGSSIPTMALTGLGGDLIGSGLTKLTGSNLLSRFLSGEAGGLLTRAAGDVVNGAATGATGAALTSGINPTDTRSLTDKMAAGAAFGGIAGPLVNPLARAAFPSARVNAEGINPQVGQAAQALEDNGIRVLPSQLAEKSAGTPEQLQAYTRAVASRFGADKVMDDLGVTGFTPDVLAKARNNISNVFENFAQNNNIPRDVDLLRDIAGAYRTAKSAVGLPDKAKSAIDSIAQYAAKVAQNPNVPGDAFLRVTSSNGALRRFLSSKDPDVREFANTVRDAFYDLAARNAPQGEAAALQAARSAWRNYRTYEPIAEKATTTGGMVNPQLVAGLVTKPGVSMDTQRLAQGARMLPSPDAVGQPRAAGLGELVQSAKQHIPALATGGGAGLAAGEYLAPLAATLGLGHSTAWLPAALGAVGLDAARGLRNAYVNAPSRTPEIIREIMNPSGGIAVNPLLSGTSLAPNYRSTR